MLFDFAETSARNRYKLLISTIVPRPIAWAVTQDARGVVNAAPFSFFNALSSNPPVLGLSIGGADVEEDKDTLANIKATGQFVVCLVPERAAHAMTVTAIDLPPHVDELAEAGLTPVPSRMVKPPRIAESPVAFECETHQLVPLGGNTLVLGRILAMHIDDDCMLDAEKCYVDTPKLGLIGRMHGGGGYLRAREDLNIPRIPLAEWEARHKG
ncbi:flavin reductase family protein [Roseomonas marmotae]|uniref:Flavin reductase family protein n=1 Tax=Roseomonas marmotae TaxID=2768161 RepID=A0ABS3KGA1_9PROT|nr:flavin reductase family protein [Roseomonas marmotae]MBO1076452.1 flavin reductase family protein [Roseomonas marmotae]QTI77946.1 flavin reductase family protein [Roseomonas marmotae]